MAAQENKPLVICTRCIMDSSVQEITFDSHGICSFCNIHDEMEQQYPLNEEGRRELEKLVQEIKEQGKNKKYDCVVGVSGGRDSTYTLLLLKQLGLRPLAVHFDNGWNTEISVSNIKNALDKLGIELYTYVVDWEEFKDLQISFLKASVPEVELPTDIAIRAALYRAAREEGLKYIIEGTSFRTEGVLPLSWGYKDGRYVKSIQKKYGSKRLKTFPNLSLTSYFFSAFVLKIKLIRLLNYFAYSKVEAKKVLTKELNWIDYGGHHHESIYTRFFQSYLAPLKFGMDRRMISFSAQIRSGLLTREEALEQMKQPIYPADKIQEDKEYIAKKLKLSLNALDLIISQQPKSFLDYPSYYPLISRLRSLIRFTAKHNISTGFFQAGNFKK